MDTDVAGCTGEAWGGSGSAAGRLVETGVGERTDPSSTAGQCATCQAWIDVGKEHLLSYTPSNVVQCDRCHGAEAVGGKRGENRL